MSSCEEGPQLSLPAELPSMLEPLYVNWSTRLMSQKDNWLYKSGIIMKTRPGDLVMPDSFGHFLG